MEEEINTNNEFQNKIIMNERKRWAFFGIPWTFTKYTLMTKKLILTEGFFKTTENEILLYRVLDMSLSRNLIQKIFKLGTVTVYAQDKTNPTLEIKNIKHAREFRDSLADAVEKDRIRMKMRQSEFIDQHIDNPEMADY